MAHLASSSSLLGWLFCGLVGITQLTQYPQSHTTTQPSVRNKCPQFHHQSHQQFSVLSLIDPKTLHSYSDIQRQHLGSALLLLFGLLSKDHSPSCNEALQLELHRICLPMEVALIKAWLTSICLPRAPWRFRKEISLVGSSMAPPTRLYVYMIVLIAWLFYTKSSNTYRNDWGYLIIVPLDFK